MPDNKNIEDLKRGDHEAFRRLFDKYSQAMYAFAFRYLRSGDAADDVVQETFLKIWNNREQLKTGTSFRSYLFTITLNAVRKHFIRQARITEVKELVLKEINQGSEDPDEDPGFGTMINTLDELISQMPELRREIFIRKKLEKKSQKEIAEEFCITTKSVEYHITEAMKFLKTGFEKLKRRGVIFLFVKTGWLPKSEL